MAKKPKQYYWLKLKDDFFRQKEIKKLRKIAGGDTYTIIYLKMLLLAIKEENKLLSVITTLLLSKNGNTLLSIL